MERDIQYDGKQPVDVGTARIAARGPFGPFIDPSGMTMNDTVAGA
ncbi:hypothetical protein [Sphingomonas sp. 1P08PE]